MNTHTPLLTTTLLTRTLPMVASIGVNAGLAKAVTARRQRHGVAIKVLTQAAGQGSLEATQRGPHFRRSEALVLTQGLDGSGGRGCGTVVC